ncbi:site-specific integrase [Nonomuraea sp. NN258]|uniref:tyrosine-type recombinase/integrase n=1 Tax=Nonomuraea antri TaxID=2730852 RepID=UPI00156A432B|nr:site-specific integrase [Nonomuraea antri]NRQ39672.1 site-specific integrase [Nonomuraea antri]
MARVRDLWFRTVTGSDDQKHRQKTKRHPDNGGSKEAKRWLAIWIGPDGKEETKAFTTKAQAQNHGTTKEADRLRGVYVDERRGKLLFREYAQNKWLPSQVHLRANSLDTYTVHLNAHLIPALGERRIGSLTRADMKAVVARLNKTLAPTTVHTVFAVLRLVLQAAVDDGDIPSNPCSRVPLPRIAARVVEPLPVEAVLALANVMTPRYKLAVWLGFGLGLRLGEALGLTVSKVQPEAKRVQVHRQAQKGELVELKTKASRRTLPIDDLVLAQIQEHQTHYSPGPEGVLITNRCRRVAQRKSFNECWREAVAKAGLPKGTRFHDLRHFYASGLIKANLNPKVIQTRLGHATIAETMDTYGHLFPDQDDLGRGAIDALLLPKLPEQRRNRQS